MTTPPRKVHLEIEGHHRHVCGQQRYADIVFTRDPEKITCKECFNYFHFKKQVKLKRPKTIEPKVFKKQVVGVPKPKPIIYERRDD